MAFKHIIDLKKNILQNFVSRMCFFASVFLINILFSRVLGAAGSGQLYYVVNNFSIVALVASLSLESGITFFLSRKELDEKELISISLVWSVIAAVFVYIIIPKQQNTSLIFDQLSLYSFFFIAGTLLTTYFSGLFFGRKQFLYAHLIPCIVNMGLLVLGVVKGGKNPHLLVRFYFVSYLVSGIALLFAYHIKYALRFSLRLPATETFSKLFHYSAIALLTNVMAFLAYRIDFWILKFFSPRIITDAALGNYIQVSKLIQLFLFIPTILATIIFPAAASADDFNFKKQFGKISLQVLMLNLIACSFLLIWGNRLFIALYGNSFALMYQCFVFSVPVIFAMTVIRILSSFFAGINKIKYNLIGCSITLIIVGVLNFLLIPSMGINGSALADSAGYVAYMIVLLYFFKRNNGKNEKRAVVN